MEVMVSLLVPFLSTALVLAVMLALTMGIGWASGKLIRKILGIGGK